MGIYRLILLSLFLMACGPEPQEPAPIEINVPEQKIVLELKQEDLSRKVESATDPSGPELSKEKRDPQNPPKSDSQEISEPLSQEEIEAKQKELEEWTSIE